MKYTALITRMLSMADESISIIVEDTEEFDTLKDKVVHALRLCDHRANVQMNRLFEDTSLTKDLAYNELNATRRAAYMMYPLEHLTSEFTLGEGSKLEFAKSMPSGEVLKCFVHEIDETTDIAQACKNIWRLFDSRLGYTNQRELDYTTYINSLDFSTRTKVTMVMDILYGRTTREYVASRLAPDVEAVREQEQLSLLVNKQHLDADDSNISSNEY